MIFKGCAILGLDHTTRDRNINWKVIIKSVTLYMIWLDHVPFLIMFGHAPPVHASISSYHILPVLIRSIHGSHPSSIPWNSHETTLYTGYLRVFPRWRGILGRDHPWSNTITWSYPTPMKLPSHAPLPLRLPWPYEVESSHPSSSLTICVCSQALEDDLGDVYMNQNPSKGRS